MHRDLKKLLHTAEGQSKKVIALFLDVRGFTTFAGLAESTDAADFLKSVYTRILDEYFDDAEYFKLTGDGMMIIYGFTDKDSLTDALRKTVDKSLKLVDAFPEITKDDPMINFDVPRGLGIGLARGSATMISSGDRVLDYTGRPLNLAARLMDLARPAGVVFDTNFGIGLLPDDVQQRFSEDAVYINGIAEETPIKVHYLADRTEISEHRKLPITPPLRVTDKSEKILFSALLERGSRYQHCLSREPAKTDDVEVHLGYPKARSDGSRNPNMRWTPSRKATVARKLNRWFAEVNYQKIGNELKKNGCMPDWPVEITLEYSVRDTGKQA